MNREAIQKWADALEFGDYQQTTGELRHGETFCALGVACDVYAHQHKLSRSSAAYAEIFEGDGFASSEVGKWLGIDVSVEAEIIRMNDTDEMSLPHIGHWVRDNLLKEE